VRFFAGEADDVGVERARQPLVDVATTNRCTSSLPEPASSLGRLRADRDLRGNAGDDLFEAFGIGARGFRCFLSPRSLAAATIFIALVIFWVDLTELIRILRALRLAIWFPLAEGAINRDCPYLIFSIAFKLPCLRPH
jgi:hypothetical protein